MFSQTICTNQIRPAVGTYAQDHLIIENCACYGLQPDMERFRAFMHSDSSIGSKPCLWVWTQDQASVDAPTLIFVSYSLVLTMEAAIKSNKFTQIQGYVTQYWWLCTYFQRALAG